MNKPAVLDASALIAVFNDEPGSLIIENILSHSVMSTVNVTEVMAYLYLKLSAPLEETQAMIEKLVDHIVPFDLKLAKETAKLKKEAKFLGLSLGDCACLALSKALHLPVYTADKIWTKLDFPNEIIVIR